MSIVEQLLAAYKEYQDDPKTLFIELKAVLDATLKPIEESIKKLTTERDACKKELDDLNGLDLDFDQKKAQITDILSKARIIAESKIAPRGVREQFAALYKEHMLALKKLEAEMTAAKATTAAKKTALEAKLAELDKKIQEANDEIKCYKDEYTKFIKDHKVTEYTADALTERTKLIYLTLSSKELGITSTIASAIQIKKDKDKWSYIADSAKNTQFKPGFLSEAEFKASAKDDITNGFTLTLDWNLSYSNNEFELSTTDSTSTTTGTEKTSGIDQTIGSNISIGVSEEDSEGREQSKGKSNSSTKETSASKTDATTWEAGAEVHTNFTAGAKIFGVGGELETGITGHASRSQTWETSKSETRSKTDETNESNTTSKSKTKGLQHTTDSSAETTKTNSTTNSKETSIGNEKGKRQMLSFDGMKETFTLQYIFTTKEDGSLECKQVGTYAATSKVKDFEIQYAVNDKKFIR